MTTFAKKAYSVSVQISVWTMKQKQKQHQLNFEVEKANEKKPHLALARPLQGCEIEARGFYLSSSRRIALEEDEAHPLVVGLEYSERKWATTRESLTLRDLLEVFAVCPFRVDPEYAIGKGISESLRLLADLLLHRSSPERHLVTGVHELLLWLQL